MANEEQVAVLELGVDVWNEWRKDNPEILLPDLSQARLKGVILEEANLQEVNLSGADLEGANFAGADLSGAELKGANLEGTNISLANLTEANLGGAKLKWAGLVGTHLIHARLEMADLEGAMLWDTVFGDLDLSMTQGLELCQHLAPSIIDYRTLLRSGKLPDSFLRGCGLPDNLIDRLPSLLNESNRFHSCFISYSSKDDDFARRLHADLQDNGVRCWFAPEDMKIGDKIRTRIDEVIRVHEKLLLVLSENSIDSEWVEKEVETAFERERETKETVLFPVRLDNAAMDSKTGWAADIKRTRNIGDFRNWKDHDAYQKGLDRLLRDLKVEIQGEAG